MNNAITVGIKTLIQAIKVDKNIKLLSRFSDIYMLRVLTEEFGN